MAAVDKSLAMQHDLTTCSICLETFKNPKALPCIHTFCLQCLDTYCKDKDSGEEATCPLCRKVFTIPHDGIKAIPTNVFIEQLIEVNKAAHTDGKQMNDYTILCELCSDFKEEIKATSHCLECDQYICDQCSVTHKKSKVATSHTIVQNVTVLNREERLKFAISYCDQHPGEQISLYCCDCKMVMCHKCHVSKHRKHDFSEVIEVAETLRKQLKDDAEKLSICAFQKQEKINEMENELKSVMEKVASAQREVSQKYDQMISLLESHQSQLLEELELFKVRILKERETVKDEMERQFVITESFQRYCQEMINKGTAFDISRTADELRARTEELLMTQDEHDCHTLSGIEISFKPSDVTTDSAATFLGELIFKDESVLKNSDSTTALKVDFKNFLVKPSLLHVMSGQHVAGITVVGNEVFLTRATSQVEVYNSESFTLTRNIKIAGSRELQEIISCSHYNCLYVSDVKQLMIYRHSLSDNVTNNWSVGSPCHRLSVTKCNQVLAAFRDAKLIRKYATDGSLISVIILDKSIGEPIHCVQLSTGNFIVSHWGDQHRVCIVDTSGHILQSYGGSPGSGLGKLACPCHLAVDKDDNVLIVDGGNNGVQLLSPTLTYLGAIRIPGHEIHHPYTLHVDELNHRLYIGECTGRRLFVLDVYKHDNMKDL